MFGTEFALAGLITDAGTVITGLAAVIGTALAFKLGPKAVSWGISKIKLGR